MAIPADFELIDQSKYYALFRAKSAVDMHRSDMLYEAGYQIVSIDVVETGALFKTPYEWRVSCLKVTPCGS